MTGTVNFNGAIGGVQVGDNNTQHVVQNNPAIPPTIEEVAERAAKSIPDETVRSEMAPELKAFLSLPQSEQEAQPNRMQQILAKVTPYAPQISKTLAVFGDAALTALGATNPLLAGLLAICRQAAQS